VLFAPLLAPFFRVGIVHNEACKFDWVCDMTAFKHKLTFSNLSLLKSASKQRKRKGTSTHSFRVLRLFLRAVNGSFSPQIVAFSFAVRRRAGHTLFFHFVGRRLKVCSLASKIRLSCQFKETSLSLSVRIQLLHHLTRKTSSPPKPLCNASLPSIHSSARSFTACFRTTTSPNPIGLTN
jgi:hypothetical protein